MRKLLSAGARPRAWKVYGRCARACLGTIASSSTSTYHLASSSSDTFACPPTTTPGCHISDIAQHQSIISFGQPLLRSQPARFCRKSFWLYYSPARCPYAFQPRICQPADSRQAPQRRSRGKFVTIYFVLFVIIVCFVLCDMDADGIHFVVELFRSWHQRMKRRANTFRLSVREASIRTDRSHQFLRDQSHQQDRAPHRPTQTLQNTIPPKVNVQS